MRIAVIGAGVVGVATAHALAQSGNEVSVFERNTAVAEGASFANGGLLAPSLAPFMAHPSWPTKGLMGWLKPTPGIRWSRGVQWRDLRWLQTWKHLEPALFTRNFQAASALIGRSQALLQAISHERGLAFEAGEGQLVLLKSEADNSAWTDKLALLKELGVAHSLLAADRARALEPALSPTQPFHSAIHLPGDAFANCRQVTQLLRDLANELGAQFNFSTPVESIDTTSGIQLRLKDGTTQAFDHVVIAAGSDEASLTAAALPRKHFATVQSYSLNAPIREPLNAPRNAILDWDSGVTLVRLGLRMRVAGGAELGCIQERHHAPTVKRLFQTLQHHYPGACSFQSGTQIWKGATLHSNDGLPAIGATAVPRLWVNVAHGHNGWGMAMASGQLLCDLMAGRATDTDPAPFSPLRWQ